MNITESSETASTVCVDNAGEEESASESDTEIEQSEAVIRILLDQFVREEIEDDDLWRESLRCDT